MIFFHLLMNHLCAFFEELSLQLSSLTPFDVLLLLLLSFVKLFISWLSALYSLMVCKYFLPFRSVYFDFNHMLFHSAYTFWFDLMHYFLLLFSSLV